MINVYYFKQKAERSLRNWYRYTADSQFLNWLLRKHWESSLLKGNYEKNVYLQKGTGLRKMHLIEPKVGIKEWGVPPMRVFNEVW